MIVMAVSGLLPAVSCTSFPAGSGRDDSRAGSFLAATVAREEGNFLVAARLADSLAVPGESAPFLAELVSIRLLAGQPEKAAGIAAQLSPAHDDRLSRLLAGVALLRQGRAGDITGLAWERENPDPDPAMLLLLSWADVHRGAQESALEGFRRFPGLPGPPAAYQKGLALAVLSGPEMSAASLETAIRDAGQEDLDLLPRFRMALRHIRAPGEDGPAQPHRIPGWPHPELGAALAGQEFSRHGAVLEGMAESMFLLAGVALRQERFRQDELERILGWLRIALWLHPGFPGALDAGGRVYLAFGDREAAAALYDRMGRLPGLARTARLGMARTQIANAMQPERGIALLRELLGEDPGDPEVTGLLAGALALEDRKEEAARLYDTLLQLEKAGNPGIGAIYRNAGRFFRQNGEPDKALRAFSRALELDPGNPQTAYELGHLLGERDDSLPQALEFARMAVRQGGDGPRHLALAGDILYRLGHHAEAALWLERAAARAAHDQEIRNRLGDVYWKLGRLREARNQWRTPGTQEETVHGR